MNMMISYQELVRTFPNILDKDYAFSDGEILMVDNAVRTHLNLMSGISKKSDLMKIPLKNIYNALTSRQ